MTLDLAHDILLALLVTSIVVLVLSHLIRRTPRVPECPRCRYRHEMPTTTTCPECGLEPKDPGAWMRSRLATPRGVRRWPMLLIPALATITASIGVLHGRWASVLPSRWLTESIRHGSYATALGQRRLIAEIKLRDLSRADAEALVRIGVDTLEALSSAPTTAEPAGDEPPTDPWHLTLSQLATITRIEHDGRIFVLGRPTRPEPNAPALRPAPGRPFLEDSAVIGEPRSRATLRAALRGETRDARLLATLYITHMGDSARPMIAELLDVIEQHPSEHVLLTQTVAALLCGDELALRTELSQGPQGRREQVLRLLQGRVGHMTPAAARVLREFLESSNADPEVVDSLRQDLDLFFPASRGPGAAGVEENPPAPTSALPPPSP